ncbi:MAG: electron transport complex subunit RsxE [Oscillospiraceae bacterium]|nr:electron transport complex subunit RsxE [Oscillospiraceae bacterium]
MNTKKQLLDGLIYQNPVTVQLLGMCSVLAITTTLFNGIGMGLSVLIILTCANIVISLIRKIVPGKIRIACYIVVIAGFVTVVDLLIKAYLPSLSSSLGLFIPLIVVNCIILGRAESFASKNSVGRSALDGIFQGLGYTVILIVMCIIREFLGNGTFGGGILNGGDGIRILKEGVPALGMILPVGGFLTLAVVIAVMQHFLRPKNQTQKQEAKEEVAE